MNLLFIYNPESGRRSIAGQLDKIISAFVKEGKLLTLYRIGADNPRDLTAEMISGRYDGVVVCGGDGSVSTIAGTIIEHGLELPLGIIPGGTCNDFARSMGLPQDVEACARLIARGRISSVDIGRVNGSAYFVNTLGGGVFINVSYETDPNLKKALGPLAYYITGIGELGKMKPFELTVTTDKEQITESALLFLVLNGPDVSGFSGVIKDAKMRDGEMDILIFKDLNALAITDSLIKIATGNEPNSKNVVRLRTSRCTIKSESDILTTLDGERGPALPLEAEMLYRALKIYC